MNEHFDTNERTNERTILIILLSVYSTIRIRTQGSLLLPAGKSAFSFYDVEWDGDYFVPITAAAPPVKPSISPRPSNNSHSPRPSSVEIKPTNSSLTICTSASSSSGEFAPTSTRSTATATSTASTTDSAGDQVELDVNGPTSSSSGGGGGGSSLSDDVVVTNSTETNTLTTATTLSEPYAAVPEFIPVIEVILLSDIVTLSLYCHCSAMHDILAPCLRSFVHVCNIESCQSEPRSR